MKAVFNSSPLIFLYRLNLLEAAFSLFEKNYVPTGVIDELTYGRKKDEEAINIIMENPIVVIKTVKYNRFYEKLRMSVGKGDVITTDDCSENGQKFRN